ncbi:Putative fructose-bisphosphate aldolase, class-II, aldolase-type TIM barrel [Septoria linicola]|uniref:Fructose-bisphosphate aldolase n=1 Tax=Septoria linicola TaxID=215465 RepID=A0A9Q9APL9_9PEZI|nr:putative fructose-bisphosphate aldolase, class-II, aldolase-type TIM barrel [Septoria linicola]USW50260.1 Putative fructose-bisphosphate aldolase, class-II, aldolase-type TIM barrel [Septoria linicola]
MGSLPALAQNKTVRILSDAEAGGYGIVASIVYNIEHIVGVVKAAEQKRSPLIIQVFPWQIIFSDGLLVRAAADAASRASVPIAIHLDHCQDEALVRFAADNLPFDSIMVDMSHHEKAENLAKTKELVAYCHARGIATEAEPGRIEGGEDGVADTVDMEGVLTTPEEVEEFIATGVDFLAPAIGNVHGEYGPGGPNLDLARLESIQAQAKGRVRLVLHGTNGFQDELTRECIQRGISKINVNKLVLEDYNKHLQANAKNMILTQLMEEGVRHVVAMQAHQMDACWSAGKAA